MINDIKEKCKKFYKEILLDSEARYKSWEYCYAYFQDNKDKVNDSEILDKMCLHLAFYLASWGMLRGSSFLLQKSYRVHAEAIKIMLQDKYKILHNIKAKELLQNASLLFDCSKELRDFYKNQPSCQTPSDTLITKIFLGVYGCVPAYDRYFKESIKFQKICDKFNEKSIEQICNFYEAHIDEFDSVKKEINNDLYSDMKLIDMYFWQIGKDLEEKQYGLVYETTSYYISSSNSQSSYNKLKIWAYKGLQKHYGEITQEINERFEKEMSVIKNQGLCDFYLTVKNAVGYAKRLGIAVGPGRGSCASSIIAYAIGITDIDPLKYNLIFERFINKPKDNILDFQIDIDDERVGEVIDYMQEKYSNNEFKSFERYDALNTVPKICFLGMDAVKIIKLACDYIIGNHGRKLDFNELGYEDKGVYDLISSGETDGIFLFESDDIKAFAKKLKPDTFEDIIASIALFRPEVSDWMTNFIDNKISPDKINYHTPLLEPILKNSYGMIIYKEQHMQICHELGGLSLAQAGIILDAIREDKVEVLKTQKDVFVYGGIDESTGLQIDGAINKGIEENIAIGIFEKMKIFGAYAFNKSHAAGYAMLAYQMSYLKKYYQAEFTTALQRTIRDK